VNKGLLQKVNDVAEWRLRRWSVVLAIAAISVALAFGGEELRLLGRYERSAFDGGEYWRLLTAHLLHLGWGHLGPNLAALLLIGALFEDLFDYADWLGVWLTAALTIDGGLYLLDPDVRWYVGLSGVLHGFVAGGALASLLRGRSIGAVLAVGLSAKLIWEQTWGPMPFTAATTGGPVIVAAHLYGSAGGLLATASLHFVRRQRSRL
jgi:rhomboid family GlyGly-CTERM serine protease